MTNFCHVFIEGFIPKEKVDFAFIFINIRGMVFSQTQVNLVFKQAAFIPEPGKQATNAGISCIDLFGRYHQPVRANNQHFLKAHRQEFHRF